MTFSNARNPSLFTDDDRDGRSGMTRVTIRAEKKRLPVGSQLNGLDEILAASRRRSPLATPMS